MRRNTVLALSTVVVMAVVAALLIVLTRGGDDAIAGVSVSDGDVPKITVDQPVEIESGDPEVATLEEGDGRKVAEGDYRVIEVAEQPAQGDQPALTRLTLRAVQGREEFLLTIRIDQRHHALLDIQAGEKGVVDLDFGVEQGVAHAIDVVAGHAFFSLRLPMCSEGAARA